MSYAELAEKFSYYLNNHTELVIWLTLIVLSLITIVWSIYSISFRYTVAVIALMVAISLWAIDRFYFAQP
ncbi:MAG: hypothetical protein SGJ17_09380 [Hyphomicrobiales bacterium]|nr:hypothetical protein [Hyphomicrobiales bacterium]